MKHIKFKFNRLRIEELKRSYLDNLITAKLNVSQLIKENNIKNKTLLKKLVALEAHISFLIEKKIKLREEILLLNKKKFEILSVSRYIRLDKEALLKLNNKKIKKIEYLIKDIEKKILYTSNRRDILFLLSEYPNDYPRLKNSIKLDNFTLRGYGDKDISNNVNEVFIIALFSNFTFINETYQTFYKLLLINQKDFFSEIQNIFNIQEENFSSKSVFLKISQFLDKLGCLDVFCINFIQAISENYQTFIFKNKCNKYKLNSLNLSTFIFELKKNLYSNKLHLINNQHKKTIYIFKGLNWSTIVNTFKDNGITVLHGNNDTKHLISDLEYKLSNLTLNIFGKKGYNYIVKSFKKSSKEIYQRKGSINIDISKEIIKEKIIFEQDLQLDKETQN